MLQNLKALWLRLYISFEYSERIFTPEEIAKIGLRFRAYLAFLRNYPVKNTVYGKERPCDNQCSCDVIAPVVAVPTDVNCTENNLLHVTLDLKSRIRDFLKNGRIALRNAKEIPRFQL